MAISRVYSSGWSVGEKLTSSQQNALDLNTTYGADKRAGFGDLINAVWQATGPGRLIQTVQTGPDANTTFHIQGGNSVVRIPTLTDARKYTIGHTGATGGDRMMFYIEGTGLSPSGYVDIANNVGTGLFRLGLTRTQSYQTGAEGDRVEVVFGPTGWMLMGTAGPGMRSVEWTSTTTWVCPPGVFELILIGYGGGGGGGGGMYGLLTSTVNASGGGGGGGPVMQTRRVAVAPGVRYVVTIGAGGAGGAGGSFGGSSVPNAGSKGSASTFVVEATGEVLASFDGADSGSPGINAVVSPAILGIARGGAAIARRPIATFPTGLSPTGFVVASGHHHALSWAEMPMSSGGWALSGATAMSFPLLARGISIGANNGGYTGGMPGNPGAWLGAICGGAGGGGGAAGPGGGGGAGGAGGDQGTLADGTAGAAGSAAAANTGGGGGGGGGGGASNNVNGGNGGAGAAGGSGKITGVFYK